MGSNTDLNHLIVHVHLQIQAPDPIRKARPKGSIGKMTVNPPGEKTSAAEEKQQFKAMPTPRTPSSQEGDTAAA